MEMKSEIPTKSYHTLNNCTSTLQRHVNNEFSNSVSVNQYTVQSNSTNMTEQDENEEWKKLISDIFEQMAVLNSSTVSSVNYNEQLSENEKTEETVLLYSKEKNYQCDSCQGIFKELSEFRQHSCSLINIEYSSFNSTNNDTTVENQTQFCKHYLDQQNLGVKCSQCHKLYATEVTLKKHQKIHNRKFICMYCNHTYSSEKQFDTHLINLHFKDQYQRQIQIQYQFEDCQTKGKKQIDNQQKKGNPKTKILMADSVIAKVISFINFLLTEKEENYKKICSICDKTFPNVSSLKWHLIKHIVNSTLTKYPKTNGPLQLICQICHKETFNKIDSYKDHLAVHAKMTLYKCNICDKPFINPSYCSKHKRRHKSL